MTGQLAESLVAVIRIRSLFRGFLSQKTRKFLCAFASLREAFWLRLSALVIELNASRTTPVGSLLMPQ
jgi:hypothetical protein